MGAVSGAFTITGLSYRYRRAERPALDGIDIACESGHIVGLLGPNGCGKTTLIKLLAGTLHPGRGSVRLFPSDPGLSPDDRRRKITACFDRVPFLESLSGRENAVRLTTLRGVDRGESARRVDQWLSIFGLADRMDDAVATYSLGMRRKLGLTEVFAAHPDLVLLDEPLGGLDAEGRSTLLATLRAERERGAAAVIAAHDPDFAAAACDTIVLMDAGRVLASGEPTALIEALGLETTFEVSLASPSEGRLALPEGVRSLATTHDALRLASARGAVALPETAAAIVTAGGEIRAIHVREPNLDDVFVSLTGRTMKATLSEPA